jgi:glycosyltransferase involved in cell wall biosynthesis
LADEAMAAGVPVVATEGGALADRLGAAGVVVPMGSPAALAHALTQLTPAMGQAGRQVVAAMDDLDATTNRFVGALAAVAHRPGAGLAGEAGPPVSVVVPVYREASTIAATLDALAAQLRADDELVVVVDDGGEGDGTVAAVRAWSGGGRATIIVRPGPAGISSARNAGIAAARHDVVACTDAGCRPHPGWVDALRAAAAERPAPALVTGLYDVAATTPMEEAFALACYPVVEEARRTGLWTTLYGKLLGRAFDPTLPTGRSMACTKEAWAAAGGFPEDLATAEDVSFGRRIAEQGGTCVLAADAVTTWDQRPTLAATARMYERYGVGDGRSRDRLLVARNLARMAAYVGGPLLAWKGGSAGRAAAVAGAAVYLSVPAARAARRRSRPATWALLPVALAVKDVAKAVGCVKGLLSPRASSRTI